MHALSLQELVDALHSHGFKFNTYNKGSHNEVEWLECGCLRFAQEDDGYFTLHCFTDASRRMLDYKVDFSNTPNHVILAVVEAAAVEVDA